MTPPAMNAGIHHLRFRWVGRYDSGARLLRLCRVVWQRGTVGDGRGCSTALSLGLRPKTFHWRRGWSDWDLTLLGVRIHHQRSWGGILT